MNARIEYLRNKSLNTEESIKAERALLVTDFYMNHSSDNLSTPVLRAKNLHYILAHKGLYFDKEELIIGERGPSPKATPTYPEVSLHSMEDLEILDSREKV